MSAQRNRGVMLDPDKVKLLAAQMNIYSLQALKDYFLESFPNIGYDTKIIADAWSGRKKIDKESARKIANCLGLDNYHELLWDNIAACPWQALITNKQYQGNFLDFVDHSNTDLNLVQLSQDNHDNLPKVSINSKWHLEIQGNKDERVFILLQSADVFYQLAPVAGENYKNVIERRFLKYPLTGGLNFDKKAGDGWRKFIVVRSTFMKCQQKNKDSTYVCSINELNLFASRIRDIPGNIITVDQYEFILTKC